MGVGGWFDLYPPRKKKQYKNKIMKKVLKVFLNGDFLQYCKVSEAYLFTSKMEVGESVEFKKVEINNQYYKTLFG